jgi:hypothetical protein
MAQRKAGRHHHAFSQRTHLKYLELEFYQFRNCAERNPCWVGRQVSDLTTSNGADSLGLSGEVRKDLLMSLQDASAMELAESWMSNTISQLIMQLSNVSSS